MHRKQQKLRRISLKSKNVSKITKTDSTLLKKYENYTKIMKSASDNIKKHETCVGNRINSIRHHKNRET